MSYELELKQKAAETRAKLMGAPTPTGVTPKQENWRHQPPIIEQRSFHNAAIRPKEPDWATAMRADSEPSVLLHRLMSLADQEGRVTVHDCLRATCKYYGYTMKDVVSKRQFRPMATARQIVMYLSKVLTSNSLPGIGRVLGNRDHTTVLHGIRKISKSLEKNAKLRADISYILDILFEE